MSPVILASVRTDVADFLGTLLFVYSLLIVIYVLAQLVFSLGGRVPYSRWSDAVLNFLRDVCEPYLRPFRRIVPMIGPIDISPIVAILVLQIVGGLIVGLIHG
jgi:YggT family protein